MPSGFYIWDRTANNNATADSAIGWAEGQSPSSVNDSARAMMSVQAKWRDDISGAIVTGGTSTSYTVATYTVFDTLAHMHGMVIAFTPHATNGATVTLNVDGLGAKPLRSSPSVELLAGTLIQGTPYLALYNNSDAVWYLHGFFGNPYNVPLMGGMDYWDTIAPNSSFIFPAGQAISRTTYAAVFARWGTTFGVGDGSTTFNVPDKTGRVSAMKETAATLLTPTYFICDSTSLGVKGGFESHTLTTAQLASHSHANSLNDLGHLHTYNGMNGGGGGSIAAGGGYQVGSGFNTSSNTTGITITNASAGSGNAHPNVQPTIICNYIIRVL